MRGRLHIIEPNGTIRLVREYVDEPVELDDLKRTVQGFVEEIPRFGAINIDGERLPCLAFKNEDDQALPVNTRATEFWQIAAGRPVSPITGPIAVLTGDGSFLFDV